MKKSTVTHRLLSLALCLCMVLSLMPGIPLVVQAAGTEGMITIEMTDSYADGWSGNAIEIYADDVLLDTVTLNSGSSGVWTTSLDTHVDYKFIWIMGSFPEDTSFVIYKGTEKVLSAEGNTYDSNSVIFELAKDCAGTEYSDSFCCTVCGKACEHVHWTESVCDLCGFVCGSSLPHIWEGGVCEICSTICSHPGAINGFCDICQYYEAPVDDDDDGYYDIDNAGKLYWFSDRVASGDRYIKGELTQDIRINHQVLDVNGNPPTDGTGLRNWVTIGNSEHKFCGKFEGNHYSISGLYYHGNHMYAGLFGQVHTAEIRNVRLADSYLCAMSDCYLLAGIVGSAYNTLLSNCHNEAVLEGLAGAGGIACSIDYSTKITNCTNSGSITGGTSTGGILGRGNGTVTYCGNTGDITTTGSYYGVGGISGYDGTISYCYNTGTITGRGKCQAGGICGITSGDVSYCYSTGNIVMEGDTATVGRILGDCNGSVATVQGCYSLSEDTGIPVVGDPNENVKDNVEVTAEQFASGEACWLMNNSCPNDKWRQNLGIDASPRLTGEMVYQVSVNLCTGEVAKAYSNSSTDYIFVHTDENKDHVCDDCGENASDCDDRNNDHNCDICGTALTTHEGEATCAAAAICTICGKRFGTIDENNHSFLESGLCTRCGVRVTASVVKSSTDPIEYFMTLEEAIAYAADIDQSTIRIHSDVQIDGEVSVGTLEIFKDATVTVNGILSAGSLSTEGNWAGDGYVNIDVNKYKVYNNKLYLLGGAAGVDWEIWNVTQPTYWTAGDGYAAFDPETGVLNLHNATIYAKAYSSDDAAVVYQNDLTINFSGINTLTTNDHNSGIMLYCMGKTVINGIGQDAVLNIYSGYRSNDNVTGEVRAFSFTDLTVNSGTLNVISGNGSSSFALSGQSMTVAEGAVVNVTAGNGYNGNSIGLMTQALTVDGTLNASSGSCGTGLDAFATCDIALMGAGAKGNGTINGLCMAVTEDMTKIDCIVYGNTSLNNDRTLQLVDGASIDFTMSEGSTLTIAEGVTLDVAVATEIDFSGTVVNNGTILLPASYDLNNAPKSGTVLIGENSFTWYEDGWYCSSESQHTGGTATCVDYAVCQLCGKEYGDKDYDNHTGDPYAQYEWYPGEDNTCYAYATLYCSGCDSYLDSANGDCELVENVEATDCLNPGHLTYRYTCTMGKGEYTGTHTIITSSENHVGQFENGFCSACGGYEAAAWNEDEGVYEISNPGQLYWYAQQLNENNTEMFVKLVADIEIPENAPNWEPINASYAYFNGNFHTISGLKCIGGDRTYVGLFGCEGWWYQISDLHITNSYFEGKEYVGAVVGCMNNGGSVTNCAVTNTTVKGDDYKVGGLVGSLSSSHASNCFSTATVIGAEGKVLIGYHSIGYGSIENCYFLSDTEDEYDGTTAMTAEDFASGKVAFLLQSGIVGEEIYDEEAGEYVTAEPEHIWGQQIGTDPYPVLGGAKVYEGYAYCDVMGYTNDPESKAQPHNYVDGVCDPCGKVCPHTEPVDGLCPDCGLKLFKVSVADNLSVGLYIVEGFYAAEGKDYVGKVAMNRNTVPSSDCHMCITVGGESFGKYSLQAGVLEIAGEYVTGDILFTGTGELLRADVDFACFDYLMGDLTPVDLQWAVGYKTASMTYTCSFCDQTQTLILNTERQIVNPATCSTEGVMRYNVYYGEVVRYTEVAIPVDPDAHIFDEATGTCSVCGDLIAEASLTLDGAVTYYRTVQEALDAAEAGTQDTPAYVTLLKDAEAPTVEVFPPIDDAPGYYEDFWLVETGIMTFDFNGFVLSDPFKVLAQKGQSRPVVTFTDSSDEQAGSVSSLHSIIANGATLIIDGGNICSVGGKSIDAEDCNITVNGGMICAVINEHGSYAPRAIYQRGGSLTVNGGEIISDYNGIEAYCVITVNGGTITGGNNAIAMLTDVLHPTIEGATINGGIISGGNLDLEIGDAYEVELGFHAETGIGATFPDGLVISEDKSIAFLLAVNTSCWADGSMLGNVYVETSDLSDYGTTVVQKSCDHSENTNQWVDCGDGELHSIRCSVCNVSEYGRHNWQSATCETPETCKDCGAIGEEALGHDVAEPTCTDPAVCAICGAIIAPPLGHLDHNNDGQCDYCIYPMPHAELCFTTISLEGNIAIHYYMILNETARSDSNAYMQFTLANGDVIQLPASEGVPSEVNGVTYYVFTCAVAAKEMTDNVISQFFYADTATEEHTYNVQTYAKHILQTSSDEKTIALVTAMLHYGAAAQNHFGHHTDELANAGLVAPDYSGVTIEGFKAVAGQGTELAKLCSASLILKSETTLRFFFTAPITAAYNGQELEVKQRGSLYYVDVAGIAAKDLDENVTITIHDGTNTAEVSFNPISYCQGVRNDTTGTFDQEMKELVSALYLYNQAANAYFAEG